MKNHALILGTALLAFAVAGQVVAKPAKLTKAAAPVAVALHGDPVAGERLYGSCMGCHSLDDNDVGPAHRGVVGRAAGAVPGYAYSKALKASGIVWTPAKLDVWLTNPQKLVPGSKMYYSVPKAQERADIIAYLAEQKAK